MELFSVESAPPSPACSLRQNKPIGPKAGSGKQSRRSKREPVGSMKLIFIGHQLCARRIRKGNGDPSGTVPFWRNRHHSWVGNRGERVQTEKEDVYVKELGGCCTPGHCPWGTLRGATHRGSHTLGGATHQGEPHTGGATHEGKPHIGAGSWTKSWRPTDRKSRLKFTVQRAKLCLSRFVAPG